MLAEVLDALKKAERGSLELDRMIGYVVGAECSDDEVLDNVVAMADGSKVVLLPQWSRSLATAYGLLDRVFPALDWSVRTDKESGAFVVTVIGPERVHVGTSQDHVLAILIAVFERLCFLQDNLCDAMRA
jgi:hypothetical protein